MAMQYLNYIKAKAHLTTAEKSEKPVLSEEDEQFLNRITSDEEPPELPPRPNVLDLPVAGETQVKDAQIALMNGAQSIPLPETPKEELAEPAPVSEPTLVQDGSEEKPAVSKPKRYWNWIRRDSREVKRQNQNETADSLMNVAEGIKEADAQPNEDGVVDDDEAKKEEEDMTIALERLNLAAVNNRVFSLSAETQELLQQFNVIFKDLVKGVPTAYDDLERLLTNSDRQLQKTFKSLPGFMQKLIESLPNKLSSTFAPSMMAAAAESTSKGGLNMENAGKAAAAASKLGFKPSLKDLVGKPSTIAAALRSIIQFLRARFPAFMGMNVLWSLALFVLLFVFWYCHKRGRETRWAKERELTDDEVAQLDVEWRTAHPEQHLTTTAEEGASIEEIKTGIEEVEIRNATKLIDNGSGVKDPEPSSLSTTVQPAERTGA